MPDRFHTPQPLGVGEFTLDGPEAHHLANVLRAKPGDALVLFNGDGCEYAAEVLAAGKRSVTVNVLSQHEVNRERAVELIIAAAMPKGDRGDWMIEKLSELGVSRFVPLITARTVVIPKESRLESLRRTVIEASKQCGRNVLMMIDEPIAWKLFAARTDLPTRKLILHPTDSEPLEVKNESSVIAIGPEGGFTDAEAITTGWSRASCGPRILRIETAAIAAALLTS